VACATAVVWIGASLFVERWQAAEAAVVVAFIRLWSDESVNRVGNQIVVLGGSGRTFSAHIEAWCSSFVLLALFGAYAAIVARGSHRRRWRAFALGAGTIVVGNLARIAATVWVGIWFGPGSIEGFHDGIAVWFAVAVVLAGFGLFVLELNPKYRPSLIDGYARSA
jgi:exosortase/archaeosortase family protein